MHFGGVDKEPTFFEKWIFKRIFMPVGIVLLAFALFTCEQQKYECKNYCKNEGYAAHKFIYKKYRPDECYCYPTSDTKSKEAFDNRVRVNPNE